MRFVKTIIANKGLTVDMADFAVKSRLLLIYFIRQSKERNELKKLLPIIDASEEE